MATPVAGTSKMHGAASSKTPATGKASTTQISQSGGQGYEGVSLSKRQIEFIREDRDIPFQLTSPLPVGRFRPVEIFGASTDGLKEILSETQDSLERLQREWGNYERRVYFKFKKAALLLQACNLQRILGELPEQEDIDTAYRNIDTLLLQATGLENSPKPEHDIWREAEATFLRLVVEQKEENVLFPLTQFQISNILCSLLEKMYNESLTTPPEEGLTGHFDGILTCIGQSLISPHEAQQIAFTWTRQLAFYLKQGSFAIQAESLTSSIRGVSICTRNANQLMVFCFKELNKILDDNVFELCDYHTVKELYYPLIDHANIVGGKGKQYTRLKKMALTSFAKAMSDDEKRLAFSNILILCNEVNDIEFVESITADASKYTILPSLILIYRDFNLSDTPYIKQKYVSDPLRAINGLQSLFKETARWREHMDSIHERLKDLDAERVTSVRVVVTQLAIYYAVTGSLSDINELIKKTGQEKILFLILRAIARNDMGGAIGLIEAVVKKSDRSSLRLAGKLKRFLGLLYEIQAESCSGEDKQFKLQKAHECLKMSSKTFNELHIHLARISEKLEKMKEAHDSLCRYVRFLREKINLDKHDFRVEQVQSRADVIWEQLSEYYEQQEAASKQRRKAGKGKKQGGGRHSQVDVMTVKQQAVRGAEASGSAVQETVPVEPEEAGSPMEVEKSQAFVVPDSFQTDLVDNAYEQTKEERIKIHNKKELLYYVNTKYDEVLDDLEMLIPKVYNPVLLVNLMQWKAWVYRLQAKDEYYLFYLSRITGETVGKLKTNLRKEALAVLQNAIVRFSRECIGVIPVGWEGNPDVIAEHELVKYCLKNGSERIKKQLAACFSTIGHVLSDDYFDWEEYKTRIPEYRISEANENNDLAKRYYETANKTNPERKAVN